MKRLRPIAAILGLCVCTLATRAGAQTPGPLQAKPTAALCDAVAEAGSDKEALLQEMLRRHAIRDEHVAQIRTGSVAAGMNSCETISAWGPPLHYSSTPAMDYRATPAIAGAAKVYDYGTRGKVGFDANGLVENVVR